MQIFCKNDIDIGQIIPLSSSVKQSVCRQENNINNSSLSFTIFYCCLELMNRVCSPLYGILFETVPHTSPADDCLLQTGLLFSS
jgi:hypothetical protein